MTKKLYIKTWGCQMNEYDSSKIIDLLNKSHNCQLIDNVEDADILLLNTCSIREKAQEKVFHQLGRWKFLKKNKPNLIIAVGGCVASQDGDNIFKRANYVDIVFGPQTIHRLPTMVENVYKSHLSTIDISFPGIEKFNYLTTLRTKKPSASVSIMEGCNKYCTYCIVPHTRGKEIHRPYKDIISEITMLASQGVREINLLGQNVNSYRDVHYYGYTLYFADLLRLVASIDGIDRIRYITSHPIHFTENMIDVYVDIPQLVSFVHIPVQSGSNNILAKMKRSYNIMQYKSIISKLRKVRPDIQISSDFIVGFPGENTFDFEQTINLIKEINFDMSFSFIYSPRPGTPASKIVDLTSNEEKKQRLYLLQKHIMQQTMQHSRRMQGTTQRVLVEEASHKNGTDFFGRTDNNRIVNFKGTSSMIGKFINVRITDVNVNALRGVVINKTD